MTFSLGHHFFSAEGLQTMRSEVQRIATEVFIFKSLFYRNIVDLQYYISFNALHAEQLRFPNQTHKEPRFA